MTKYVYRFGEGEAEGRADMRALLGGKGANLAEMSRIGLPVPRASPSAQKHAPIFIRQTSLTRQA